MALVIVALSVTSIAYAETELEGEQAVEQAVEQTEMVETTPVVETTTEQEASEWFAKLWDRTKEWCISAFASVSLSTIVGAIVVVAVKKATSKGFDTIEKSTNAQTIADKTTDLLAQKLGATTMEVDIKPLMESQYKALNEQINAEFKLDLQKQDSKTLATLEAIEKLGAYFDCSIAVSDEAKAEFKEAIEKAKTLYTSDTKVMAKIEVVAEAPKTEKKKKVVENY